MGLISLPERGQPLDVNYIYEMANQIYELQKATTNTSTNISRINGVGTTNNRVIFYANSVSMTYPNVISGESREFEASLQGFTTPPQVTATVLNTAGATSSTAGDNVSLVLTLVSNDIVKGKVRFGTPGPISLLINIMAIGIA
jgi:hypothetical protein